MYRLLAMCCLVGMALAVPLEDHKEHVTAIENTARTLTGPVGMALTQAAILTLVIIGIIYLVLEILNGIGGKTATKEEPVVDYYNYSPDYATGYSSYTSYESRAAKESIMTQVLNSIDPVDMSFRFMEVDDIACRKRSLCELSATPVIGQLVRYISPSISSLKEYQEALSAGEALQDCALLFAECRENQYFDRK